MRVRAVVAILAVVGAATTQAADQVILGQSLLVKDPAAGVDPSRRSVEIKARELTSDNTLVGNPVADGATIELIGNGAYQQGQTLPLPPGSWWRARGNPPTQFRYSDAQGVNGPVRSVLVQRHNGGTFTLRVAMKGAGIDFVPPGPGTDGGMRLTLNSGDTYCVGFGGAAGGVVTNRLGDFSRDPNNDGWLTRPTQWKIVTGGASPTMQAGCPSPRVTNNGDGTVTDHQTGLQWELKTLAPDPLHNVDQLYAWAGCCGGQTCDVDGCRFAVDVCQPNAAAEAACKAQTPQGQWASGCNQCAVGTCTVRTPASTTVWDWLSQVNAANFAGHGDWRLPSQSGCDTPDPGPPYGPNFCPPPAELQTIYASSVFAPLKAYPSSPLSACWSGSTVSSFPLAARTALLNFQPPASQFVASSAGKEEVFPVRAVR